MVYFSSILKDKVYNGTLPTLLKNLTDCDIGYEFLNKTNDIWCRDYMPVQVGKDQFAQFSLSKDYYQKKDQHLRTDPAPICLDLGITPTVPLFNGKPIFLDGGNVIRGFGKAIICDKVFKDNDILKTKLIDILGNSLKVDEVISIPQEPYESCGHADGQVRWLDEKTVLANDYAMAGSNKRFMDQFYGALAGAGLDIILVPYCPVDSQAYIQPSIGCYINFLQVGEHVFLPTFEDKKNNERAIERFGEIFGEKNVVPVPCLEISKLGGCLNCVSWES